MSNNPENELLIKSFIEESVTFANFSFVPKFDVPEELEDYIFINFFCKDNSEAKNEENKSWWRFLMTISHINARIHSLKASDTFQFLENNSLLDVELNKWNDKGAHAYKDLTMFLTKHIKLGLTYSAALGFWILWNMKDAMPTHAETKISSAIGAFILTSVAIETNNFWALYKGATKNNFD